MAREKELNGQLGGETLRHPTQLASSLEAHGLVQAGAGFITSCPIVLSHLIYIRRAQFAVPGRLPKCSRMRMLERGNAFQMTSFTQSSLALSRLCSDTARACAITKPASRLCLLQTQATQWLQPFGWWLSHLNLHCPRGRRSLPNNQVVVEEEKSARKMGSADTSRLVVASLAHEHRLLFED